MALRLRRDVQKASYYVWFLGAEEAKGLRGHRVINSVLPYLVDRSRTQEPIKVTLQVSHKGIKIIQGSSKHFIPHSAITSSVQTDDIVACVLLLYNPITKCPLHVHAYRCDSETTAEALNQQLQILINRPENQKRFEDLESRLGIIPGMPSLTSNKSLNNEEINYKKESQHYDDHHHKPIRTTRHDPSSKRIVSSLGSDTGNSTRESECSEDIRGNSPISRSPSGLKPLPLPQQLPNAELFDSLAAELRAKLNGNGPPLLLPPRDYDTVHRSKGNLTAIELRRCRNQLIVGSNRPGSKTELLQNLANSSGKQVSSRGSSGIGSDLAPSPERQDIATSSDDEQWSNEADNSVIALKPSQISVERTAPVNQHHMNLTRKNAVHPRDDSYLRDLPNKPYSARDNLPSTDRDPRSKTPSSSWTREDEIKPIIVRPSNYDSKINRVLQSEQYAYNHHKHDEKNRERSKGPNVDKSEELTGLIKKNMSLTHDTNDQRYKYKSNNSLNDFEDNHHPSHAAPHHGYRKENLTDKQKFLEYSTSKTKPLPHTKSYAADEVQRYGGKHRYVDPADLPFEQNAIREKYAGYHRESNSPDQSELSHRSAERKGTTSRDVRDYREGRNEEVKRHHSHDRERERNSRSNDRNPYREPESIPYIESMEKMMKSSAIRYKSYDSNGDLSVGRSKEPLQGKLSQRSKAHSQHEDEREYSYNYPSQGRHEPYNSSSSNKERFMEAKEKFRVMEKASSRYDLADEKDGIDYKHRSRVNIETSEPKTRSYDDWSDEEHLYDDPPPEFRSRSRSRDQWAEHGVRSNAVMPSSKAVEVHGRTNRPRDASAKRAESRNRIDNNDYRDPPRYRDQPPLDHHTRSEEPRIRDRDHSREYTRRDYSPDRRSGSERANRRSDRSIERHRNTDDPYPPNSLSKASPSSSGSGIGTPAHHGKAISNMPKGYRHSYAEPVFSRSAGRVGLAAVNPY